MNKSMNKVLIISVLMLSIFLVGCLDYKMYDVQKGNADDEKLLNELAQIEEELAAGDTENPTAAKEAAAEEQEVTEDVVVAEPSKEATEAPEGEMQAVRIKENEVVRLRVKVADPDGDNVTYQFSAPLDKEGAWKTNYGDAGEYLATITATDGRLKTEKNIKIIVERVNVPPVIERLVDLRVKEGERVSFQPKVSDPNNDPVTVAVSEPLAKGTFTTDHTSAGEYLVTVTANDGELFSEATFKVVVADVNVLPEVSNVPERMQVKEGEAVALSPVVSDLDNDPLKVTVSDPVGDDGTWETKYTDHGEYMVLVTVTDGKDTVKRNVALTVEDVNMPPEIVEISLATG